MTTHKTNIHFTSMSTLNDWTLLPAADILSNVPLENLFCYNVDPNHQIYFGFSVILSLFNNTHAQFFVSTYVDIPSFCPSITYTTLHLTPNLHPASTHVCKCDHLSCDNIVWKSNGSAQSPRFENCPHSKG